MLHRIANPLKRKEFPGSSVEPQEFRGIKSRLPLDLHIGLNPESLELTYKTNKTAVYESNTQLHFCHNSQTILIFRDNIFISIDHLRLPQIGPLFQSRNS